MSKDKRISSVEFLWSLIPEDTQNIIAMEHDGLNRALNMYACEIADAVDGFPLHLRAFSGKEYCKELFGIEFVSRIGEHLHACKDSGNVIKVYIEDGKVDKIHVTMNEHSESAVIDYKDLINAIGDAKLKLRKVREYYSPTVQYLLDEADAEYKKEIVDFVVSCIYLLPCSIVEFRRDVEKLYDKKFIK